MVKSPQNLGNNSRLGMRLFYAMPVVAQWISFPTKSTLSNLSSLRNWFLAQVSQSYHLVIQPSWKY